MFTFTASHRTRLWLYSVRLAGGGESQKSSVCLQGSGGSVPGSKATPALLEPQTVSAGSLRLTPPGFTGSPKPQCGCCTGFELSPRCPGAFLITFPSSHLSPHVSFKRSFSSESYFSASQGPGEHSCPSVPMARPGNGVRAGPHAAGLRWPPGLCLVFRTQLWARVRASFQVHRVPQSSLPTAPARLRGPPHSRPRGWGSEALF